MGAVQVRRSLVSRLRQRTRQWARRRHGIDPDPLDLSPRRIYILPTWLGVSYSIMVFVMFLGAMNYANNLALGLAFLLGSLALVAMHYCHRNLATLRIGSGTNEPVFAGDLATFKIALENSAPLDRREIMLASQDGASIPTTVEAGGRAIAEVRIPAKHRGVLKLESLEVSTAYPFGLFRAWSYAHIPMQCLVYPRPGPRGRSAPPLETDTGGAQDTQAGDEDFAGLRSFHPGDSPRRIAWKAYARSQNLQVKVYAGTAVTSYMFDWESLPSMQVEARLSQLCRWIEDAYTAGRAFGLILPNERIAANVGPAHRHRCLTALALFNGGEARD